MELCNDELLFFFKKDELLFFTVAIGLFNDELHLLLMSSDCTVNVSGFKSIELTENSEEHGMIQLQSCSIEALKENSLLAMRCMISYQSLSIHSVVFGRIWSSY